MSGVARADSSRNHSAAGSSSRGRCRFAGRRIPVRSRSRPASTALRTAMSTSRPRSSSAASPNPSSADTSGRSAASVVLEIARTACTADWQPILIEHHIRRGDGAIYTYRSRPRPLKDRHAENYPRADQPGSHAVPVSVRRLCGQVAPRSASSTRTLPECRGCLIRQVVVPDNVEVGLIEVAHGHDEVSDHVLEVGDLPGFGGANAVDDRDSPRVFAADGRAVGVAGHWSIHPSPSTFSSAGQSPPARSVSDIRRRVGGAGVHLACGRLNHR
jgi:hypothetical protein